MTERTKEEIEARLTEWLKAIETFKNDEIKKSKMPYTAMLEMQRGSKFIRVVSRDKWPNESAPTNGYVYCFIEIATGNIYKAAGWKAPAKHVRGSIFDDNYSIGKGVTSYGGAYLR